VFECKLLKTLLTTAIHVSMLMEEVRPADIGVAHINHVMLRQAQLVLRLVTIRGHIILAGM